MNSFLITGTTIVFLALACYFTAILSQTRHHKVTVLMLRFLVLGVSFDATATGFMIAGSSRGLFTLHGILGYIALGAMFLDTILIWRFHRRHDRESRLPTWLHRYSLAAFSWWMLAFVVGALLATRMARPH